MADRSSAAIIGGVFEALAEEYGNEGAQGHQATLKRLACCVFEIGMEYDFAWYQCDADDAMMTLGLARRVPDGSRGDQLMIYGWEEDDGQA